MNISSHGPTPLVSICIPSYNGEQFIEQALASALNQSYPNIEIIIADDASTDHTLQKLSCYKVHHPKIKIYPHQQNLGLVGNWNRALQYAQGDYIKILPQDDLIYPTCIEEQLKLLFGSCHQNNILLVSSLRNIINQQGKVLMQRGARQRKLLPARNTPWIMSGNQGIKQSIRAGTNTIGEPASVLFSRQTLSHIGCFDPSNIFLVDLDMWVRILAIPNSAVAIIQKPLAAFRISTKSTSVSSIPRHDLAFMHFIDHKIKKNRIKLNLTRGDLLLGKFMAKLNYIFRKIFYRLFLS
ncbi:MAG: glycosyltransferase [Oligoflexia bacterium]|nr:glycosyltransferase [Oligoflexia bacterium]MBF0365800.1 glycosyltransferase [Oligoflexia bacterium]